VITRIGAHRGFAVAATENTVPAVVAARRVADFAEIDVRAAGDGVPVLAHDPVVGGRAVADTPAHELAALDLGHGAGVPTLAEALAAADDLPIDLELKPDVTDPDLLATVVGLARPGDWLTSFRWDLCAAARALDPTLATGLLVDEGWDAVAALEAARAGGHRQVAVHRSLATEGFVLAAASAGVGVAVWTVNDPGEARRLADYGVEAIITDRPDLIRPEVHP
jgi:glycerophosphoryl diester phosphodiesterase